MHDRFGFGTAMVCASPSVSPVQIMHGPLASPIHARRSDRKNYLAPDNINSDEGGMTLRESAVFHCLNASVNQLSMLIAPPT